MSKSRPRLFIASRKAFLVKLVSALGFGGMVGFCVIACDKQIKLEPDIAEDSEGISTNAHVEDIAPVEDIAANVEVLEPIAAKPEVEPELEMSEKYGPPPLPEPKLAPRYSARMPGR